MLMQCVLLLCVCVQAKSGKSSSRQHQREPEDAARIDWSDGGYGASDSSNALPSHHRVDQALAANAMRAGVPATTLRSPPSHTTSLVSAVLETSGSPRRHGGSKQSPTRAAAKQMFARV